MGLFNFKVGKKEADKEQLQIAQKKVLVVEDDDYLRDFYKELLQGEGYFVLTAANGQIGYDTIIAEKPHLVLLDLMMPVMDGKQMLHLVRSLPEFKNLPVIVLTNAGSADNMKETKFYDNANDFLIKSNVEPPEIILKIRSLININ